METSPGIPDKIIAEFKYSFSKSEEFAVVSKPEICDVLIATEKFRNPWYTEENQAKRLQDSVIQSAQVDMKKKLLDQKNHLAVQSFCKTFFDLNHREPMESEVINNLSDTIDVETIKAILEGEAKV